VTANLVFNPETHVYSRDGQLIPNVTSVLKSVGLIDDRFFNDVATTRGEYVHLACQYLEQGTLDESTLDDEIKPYVDGYKAFKRDTEFVADEVEQIVFCESLQYAGTLDLMGTLFGKVGIIDIKTGNPQPWAAIQLAGYALARGMTTAHRYALRLLNNGTYKLIQYKDPTDFNVWLSALNVYQFKERTK